jgi:hypothetical protein
VFTIKQLSNVVGGHVPHHNFLSTKSGHLENLNAISCVSKNEMPAGVGVTFFETSTLFFNVLL